MGEAGDGEEDRRMDSDGTGDTVMGRGKERAASGDPPRHNRDFQEDGRHPHEDAKEVACGDTTSGDHCHCRHVDFVTGSYLWVGNDALIQRINKL